MYAYCRQSSEATFNSLQVPAANPKGATITPAHVRNCVNLGRPSRCCELAERACSAGPLATVSTGHSFCGDTRWCRKLRLQATLDETHLTTDRGKTRELEASPFFRIVPSLPRSRAAPKASKSPERALQAVVRCSARQGFFRLKVWSGCSVAKAL